MISITPAIKSLKIRNLGLIRKADMNFTKGINIIYGVCGSGKTIVINAIDHLACGERLIYTSTKVKDHVKYMKLTLELIGSRISKDTNTVKHDTKILKIKTKSFGKITYFYNPYSVYDTELGKEMDRTKMGMGEYFEKCSKGENTYLLIVKAIEESCKGQALLLDDVFCELDQEHRERAFEILKKSRLQVIMTARREIELTKGANVIRLKFVKRNGKPAVYS